MDNESYAKISIIEYKNMINTIIKQESNINKLRNQNQRKEEKFKIYEKLFLDRLADSEKYYLETMKKAIITDYNYQQLFDEFLKIGITDMDYIDLKIKELKNRFDSLKESEVNSNEN